MVFNMFVSVGNGGFFFVIGYFLLIYDFFFFICFKLLIGLKFGLFVIDDVGGYFFSWWVSGDKNLRVIEDEREKYRLREWGGKYGDLGGRENEWR